MHKFLRLSQVRQATIDPLTQALAWIHCAGRLLLCNTLSYYYYYYHTLTHLLLYVSLLIICFGRLAQY